MVAQRNAFVHRTDWVIVVAVVSAVGCDDSRPLVTDGGQSCVVAEMFKNSGNPKMDALFVIDDSPGMAGMQDKLAKAFPSFIAAFKDPTWGYPNLHLAVVSASMGGGRFANVPGCEAGSDGARDGAFRHPAGSGLAAGETFMRFNGSPLNFQGDPGAVFSALASVGDGGCPYAQPLAAAVRALTRAQDPSDPDNGGFLRDDASLFVAIVTNQDDCSVPADSDLFDPSQVSVADPYGGPGAYRCTEFGLLCDGLKPPHAPAGDISLNACVPAEGAGRLTSIGELSAALLDLKSDPDEISVSLIGGPAEPVVVGRQAVALGTGVTEDEPRLEPSCVGASGESATPGVRLQAWANGFGPNGVFLPACVDADVLQQALLGELNRIDIGYEPSCVDGIPVSTDVGLPNCVVTQTSVDEAGTQVQWELPHCDVDRTVVPCWNLKANATQCLGGGSALSVCRDPSCMSSRALTPPGSIAIRCQIGC